MHNEKKKMPISARERAAELVYEVMERGAYANLLLEKRLRNSELNLNDRRMITEIVNGTIRMVKHLDWVLNLFLKGDIHKQNRWLRSLLRISAYQILFMDRIPEYAVVNDAVEITSRKSGAGLGKVANGVLRNLLRQRDSITYPDSDLDYLAVYYSHPGWIVEMLLEQYGREGCEKILRFNNQSPKLVLRVNYLKSSPEQIQAQLASEGVGTRRSPFIPSALRVEESNQPLIETDSFKRGHFYIQNESSMLAAFILRPQTGQLVYDLCCGIGGKSTHLAECMNNEGRIMAFDLYEKKIRLQKDNCRRLGIKIVEGIEADIIGLSPDYPAGSAVLLDAPCSGFGVFARRSDARWKTSPEDVKNLPTLQELMLHRASGLVAPGGLMLYSTCTINKQENQDIIGAFLKENPQFHLEDFRSVCENWALADDDRLAASQGMLCLLPGKYDIDGMFYALMRRKA